MPLDDAETLSRHLQQYKKSVQDFQQTVPQLGTDKDTAARDRIKRLRTTIQGLEGKVQETINNHKDAAADDGWDRLKQSYTQTKRDYDAANISAKKKERVVAGTTTSSMNEQGDSGSGASPRQASTTGTGEVRIQEIKQVDMSELRTKEALENEKLQGAHVIESEMRELKATYQEFNDLVNHQQAGIDRMSSNVSEARVHVEKGIVELQEASKHQKSSRKKLCLIIAALIIVFVVVGVVVFLSTRGS